MCTHQPVHLHAHTVDGSVSMQQLVFAALAFVVDHHTGTAFDLGECVGDASHFLTKRVVQCEEMMNLRVERRLSRCAVVAM